MAERRVMNGTKPRDHRGVNPISRNEPAEGALRLIGSTRALSLASFSAAGRRGRYSKLAERYPRNHLWGGDGLLAPPIARAPTEPTRMPLSTADADAIEAFLKSKRAHPGRTG